MLVPIGTVIIDYLSACYGVLRFIMESGAKGCEVVVSGKLRGQRAKSMKFVDGLMIHSGFAVNEYIQESVRHVLLRQGLLVVWLCNIAIKVYSSSCISRPNRTEFLHTGGYV